MVSNSSTGSYDGKQLMVFKSKYCFLIFHKITEKRVDLAHTDSRTDAHTRHTHGTHTHTRKHTFIYTPVCIKFSALNIQ